jgi:DNA-binding protein H-NS
MGDNFDSLSIDELWELHEALAQTLAERLSSEKSMLEARLAQLKQRGGGQAIPSAPSGKSERRPYPKVFPKYRNPNDPSETWAGRGKQPRWLAALLETGKQLEDFRIPSKAGRRSSNEPLLRDADPVGKPPGNGFD